MGLIEQYVPAYDVQDYHETQVRAPAETAYAVLRALDLNRSWLVQALFALRGVPRRLLRCASSLPSGTFLAQALAIGWVIPADAGSRAGDRSGDGAVEGGRVQPRTWWPDAARCGDAFRGTIDHHACAGAASHRVVAGRAIALPNAKHVT